MKRVLLICLSLVLALVGGSAVCAQDGFYVIPTMKRNYAPVPKTGQTNSYAPGDDGAVKKGVAWPAPRFTDNGDNTVTDSLTKLVWTKNANYWGTKTWMEALELAGRLHDEYPVMIKTGVHDGSKAGDWRLPNRKELESLVDCGFYYPALPNTLGTGRWSEGNPFQGVPSYNALYWSSSTNANLTTDAWHVNFDIGNANNSYKSNSYYVWCVRDGP